MKENSSLFGRYLLPIMKIACVSICVALTLGFFANKQTETAANQSQQQKFTLKEKDKKETKSSQYLKELLKINGSKQQNYEFQHELINFASKKIAKGEYEDLLNELNSLSNDEDKKFLAKLDWRNRLLLQQYKAECNFNLKKYDLAYQQYLALETMLLLRFDQDIGDMNHSLYSKIQKMLKKSKKESTRFNRKNLIEQFRIDKKMKILFIILLLLIPLAISFWKWHCFYEEEGRMLPRGLTKKIFSIFPGIFYKEIFILKKDEIITEEEMQKQDGRVSNKVYKDVKNKLDDKKVYKNEKKKYAAFICLGHKMIEHLNKNVPYPLAFIAKFPGLRKLPYFWAFTIFSFAYGVGWGLSSYNLNGFINKDDILYQIITFSLITIVLFSFLVGIRLMARKTIDSLDELITMVESKESIDKLKKWLRGLLRSPWQLFITIVFTGFCLLKACLTSQPIGCVDMIFIFFLVWFASPMIWFILRSFSLTNSICKLKDLKTSTNPLSPLKTLGIQKWITVIGNYAVVGSMVLTFGASLPVILSLIKHDQITINNFVWLIFFLPLLIIYWIFPYVRLSEVVRSIKLRRMHFLKTMISKRFEQWRKDEEGLVKVKRKGETKDFSKNLNLLDKYYDLFQKLDRSPESYFDFHSFFELTKVIGLPSLVVAIITSFFL